MREEFPLLPEPPLFSSKTHFHCWAICVVEEECRPRTSLSRFAWNLVKRNNGVTKRCIQKKSRKKCISRHRCTPCALFVVWKIPATFFLSSEVWTERDVVLFYVYYYEMVRPRQSECTNSTRAFSWGQRKSLEQRFLCVKEKKPVRVNLCYLGHLMGVAVDAGKKWSAAQNFIFLWALKQLYFNTSWKS